MECPIVVRSGGLLDTLTTGEHPQLIGDFSLNAANAITAGMLLQLGLTRLTPAHDLNADQVTKLAASAGAGNLEVIAYHHLPVFHMEHCVFCRFLSTGTTFEDCGHPCETHRVSLRDENGREHPVMADVGCRNTVFGAQSQQASRYMDTWISAGIEHFRLEFVHEQPTQLFNISKAFGSFLDGESSSIELHDALKRNSPQGVTEGSLLVSNKYLKVL